MRAAYRNDDPPDEPIYPCPVCHYADDACTCPECVCGAVGDPACVNVHMAWQRWPHFHGPPPEPEDLGWTPLGEAFDLGGCAKKGG